MPSEKSLANLRPSKKGEVRNPKGINGWSKMRERYRDRLSKDMDMLADVLIAEAKSGNLTALRAALGPVIDVRSLELSDPHGEPIDFAGLAAKANGGASHEADPDE